MTIIQNKLRANESPLDIEPQFSFLKSRIGEGATNAELVKDLRYQFYLDTTTDSITRFRKRHGLGAPKQTTKVVGDEATVSYSDIEYTDLNDPDKMLEDRGLDPSQWNIEQASVTEWEGPLKDGGSTTYHRANLVIKKKKSQKDIIVPARIDGWKPAKRNYKPSYLNENIAIFSDHHAPYHDKNLHRLVIDWLEDNTPDTIVIAGDLLDFPDISRHRFDPAWSATTQECIDAGYKILRDYVEASPNSEFIYIEGNHENRLRNTLIDYARDLYGLRPGSEEDEIPEAAAFSLRHLLRLDELGIEYIGEDTTYEHTKVKLSDKLAVIHGDIAVKGSGSSALKTLERYGHSIIQGHSHRSAIVYSTVHDIDGDPETLLGAEIGCLCQIKGGLGYSVNPNWQNGFGTVTMFQDGRFHVNLATYVNNNLYYKDIRYE